MSVNMKRGFPVWHYMTWEDDEGERLKMVGEYKLIRVLEISRERGVAEVEMEDECDE